jgi:hypothetical protein
VLKQHKIDSSWKVTFLGKDLEIKQKSIWYSHYSESEVDFYILYLECSVSKELAGEMETLWDEGLWAQTVQPGTGWGTLALPSALHVISGKPLNLSISPSAKQG